jgi:hypothetical protein
MNFLRVLVMAHLSLWLFACGGGGGNPGTNGVQGSSASTQTASVTYTATPGTAASISLASGDKADNSDPIFYQTMMAATVVDAKGLPVKGAEISLRVEYPGFYKGQLFRTADFSVVSINEFFCVGEDKNNNDTLDPGEDLNQNTTLDPAKALVTASIEGATTTDANGNVSIKVRWPKRHAFWVEYKLIVVVKVTGTEGRSAFDYRTGFVAGDEKLESTPFVTSPYGVGSSCLDTR